MNETNPHHIRMLSALQQHKTVLVPGCSAGSIGWSIARVFHERGCHVFATASDTSNVAGFSELNGANVLKLDVTDAGGIARCRDEVARRATSFH
jgi:1-acylglycerone phosphate reductase